MDKKPGEGPKEAYESPAVQRIKLVKSELAAVGCKRPMATMGPAVGCVRFGACRLPGS